MRTPVGIIGGGPAGLLPARLPHRQRRGPQAGPADRRARRPRARRRLRRGGTRAERLAAQAGSLAVGDPYREQVHLGLIIDDAQTTPNSPGSRGWWSPVRHAARSSRRAGTTTGSSTGRPCLRESTTRLRPTWRRSSDRSPRAVLRHARQGRGPRLRGTVRTFPGHRHPGHGARPRTRRPHPDGHRSHQRPDRQRRGRRALRRDRRLRHRRTLRRRGDLDAFTDVRWTTVRGDVWRATRSNRSASADRRGVGGRPEHRAGTPRHPVRPATRPATG